MVNLFKEINKKINGVILSFIIFTITACGQRNLSTEAPLSDGNFFYRNNLLKFSFILPNTFDHYQTQRISGEGYTDLEVLVPTSDESFGKQVSGYAKPIVVRVFDKDAWKVNNQNGKSIYKFLGDKQDHVFTILFWEQIPDDWGDNWNDEVENSIVNSFEIE